MIPPRSLRFLCSVWGVLSALLLLPIVGSAQDKSEAPAAERAASTAKGRAASPGSAKASALRVSGLVRDPITGEMMIGSVVYVKIAPGVGDPVRAALTFAEMAGVQPLEASVSGVAPFLPPLQPVRSKKAERSVQRDAVAEARTRLLSLVELRYAGLLSPRDVASRLRSVPEVEYAEPILVPRLLGPLPNDPLLSDQLHLPLIRAFDAWNLWRGDTATLIGIVDAGIDNTHEDLVPNIAVNPGESGTDGSGKDKRTNNLDDDGNGVVDDWRGANLAWQADGTLPSSTRGSAHGTQVAGLAAAAADNGIGVAGTGYNCRMIPVKAASNTSGYLTYAYEGLMYCAARGCRVINCSFGSNAYSEAEQEIVTAITGAYNCAIVAAGGNDFSYAGLYPAGYRGVLGVGGVDTARIYRTTWGEHIDLAAPTGTSTNDGNGYTSLGPATSYTTPVVSGALALVRSRWPQLTSLQAAAHLRWACDSLPGLSPALRNYTGAGVLNMERSLAVDPFEHPAIVFDSVDLLDTTGAVSERFVKGERGVIRLRLRNLLGAASGVQMRARIADEDTGFVLCDSGWVPVGAIVSGGVRENVQVPFRVVRRSSLPLRLHVELVANGGYHDRWTTPVRFSPPYITVRTADLRVSLTDGGRIGIDGMPGSTGDGVAYNGTSMLFEGGVVMGTDADHVISNVRHDDGLADVALSSTEAPDATNGGVTKLSDSSAGTRAIGLELALRLLVKASVADAFGLELVVHNQRPSAIDTLQVAMFADWDLGGEGNGQRVRLGEESVPNVGLYGVVEDQQGGAVAHGLAAPVPKPIFVAFRNDSVMAVDTSAGVALSLYDGFTSAEKWWTLSHGVAFRNAGTGKQGESDVSLAIGQSLMGLGVDARDTLLFVFGFGPNQTDAKRAMERFLAEGTTETPAASGRESLLSAPFPQPAVERCLVRVHGSGTLQLFDAAGREVANFSAALDGNRAERLLVIDTQTLPSGRYLLNFLTPKERIVQPLLIAH